MAEGRHERRLAAILAADVAVTAVLWVQMRKAPSRP